MKTLEEENEINAPAKKKIARKKTNLETSDARAFSKNFCDHVKKIKAARKAADKATSQMNDSNASLSAAKAALAISWEAVFDYCCASGSGEVSLSSLNSLAGVIHKLAASNLQLKNMEAKMNSELGDADENSDENFTLSEDAVEEIERKLKLL